MVFENIEKLKRLYTNKYVVVDGSRPELARFDGATGVVKTVNMNGRALVEFDQWDNIGWYDIELDYLKFTDKPLPKVEKKEERPAKTAPVAGEAAKKPPASKPAVAPKPKAEVAGAAAAGTAAASKKMSTADILAAARATAGAAGAAAPAKHAAAQPAPSTAGEMKAPSKKLSTAEILAAARAKAAPEAPAPVVETAEEVSTSAEAEVSQAIVTAPAVTSAKKSAPAGALPTTTAEKIAWCREHDAQ
jgi:hypothetical protein